MTYQNKKVRIAIVGCGAIAQAHARAIAAVPGAECTALYDVDAARAESLRAAYFPEARVVRELREAAEFADAAIVAVPNAYHSPVTNALLRGGLHVLCEKPLAISSAEAFEMVATAKEHGRVLACGFVRRFFGSTRLAAEAIRRGLVGRPTRFEVHESVWNWPLSRAAFDQQVSGGGVLIDLGPHVLDLIEVWFGPPEVIEYLDDSRGGVEAVAMIRLRSKGQGGGGVTGQVFLSRAYRAVNRTRIFCERGYIEVDPHRADAAAIVYTDGGDEFVTEARAEVGDPFAMQLRHFLASIEGEDAAMAAPTDAVRAVELIESCYRMRRPLPEPWTNGKSDRAAKSSGHKKVLVTGAAGSVGSRLVELWAERGGLGQLRCMVRGYRTAARIMRYPVEVVEADLLDVSAVREAARGCDAIIHLGVGENAERETQSIVAIANELGIRRFVHLSTAAVYGRLIPASVEMLQEETPMRKTGEPYADEKANAERVAIEACKRGLQTVILRPHIVYGPGLRWSAEIMSLLAEHQVPVVEDGGWCNLIYVDDLVEAIRLALVTETGFGKPLFVTDGAPLKWSEYVRAHAALLGAQPDQVTRQDVVTPERNWRAWAKDSVTPLAPVLRSKEFRSFVFESPAVQATVFPAYLKLRDSWLLKPYVAKMRAGAGLASTPAGKGYDEMWTALQLSEARLSSARAEALLGFRAAIDFGEGLRRTVAWLALYNLAPVDRSAALAAD